MKRYKKFDNCTLPEIVAVLLLGAFPFWIFLLNL